MTWETLTTFKTSNWFAATLNTLLIDDDITLIKAGGDPPGLGVQFKETLGVGLSFKL